MERTTVLTATEASRRFAAVLERAKLGESFAVVKNGVPVARIVPPDDREPNGAAVLAFLQSWPGGAFDDTTESLILGLRQPGAERELEDEAWYDEYR